MSQDTTTTTTAGKFVQFGDHIDTLETVDIVFRKQRKLSFTYGAVFFLVTLAVPTMTVAVEGWYGKPIWGGFTPNYLFVSLIYFAFLWIMAWTYAAQADKLDNELFDLAEANEARIKSEGSDA